MSAALPQAAAPPREETAGFERDPRAIYARSFALLRAEADFRHLVPSIRPIAERMIHACGMPELAPQIRISADALTAGRAALAAGAPILADCRMLAAGISRALLPARNPVLVTLDLPEAAEIAARTPTTRSAAAVDLWTPYLNGAIAAIGNAPTALFRLLELLAAGAPRPAVIIGLPVGFVGAAEAKAALATFPQAPPFVTLLGRAGGSGIAAAAVNALAAKESPG